MENFVTCRIWKALSRCIGSWGPRWWWGCPSRTRPPVTPSSCPNYPPAPTRLAEELSNAYRYTCVCPLYPSHVPINTPCYASHVLISKFVAHANGVAHLYHSPADYMTKGIVCSAYNRSLISQYSAAAPLPSSISSIA